MVADAVMRFLESQPVGVVGTRRRDGGIRQTLVYYVVDGGRIAISTEAARAKTRDVLRDGWASLCVTAHERPWPSVTVEGEARIRTEGIGETTAKIMAVIAGQPPGEPVSDSVLAARGRVILEMDLDRAYGASYLPDA